MRFIKKINTTKIYLILIVVLFLVTRLYKINEIPQTLYWDEASIGYNAYAISQDLKDEWGEVLPIHFRAFGEFKLPVYIYATALTVKVFGLNIFAVRLPAVIFSLGSVLLVYFLSKRIYKNELVGLLSAFIFVITPWYFILSRTGYEATAGLMFYLLGLYLALISFNKPKIIVISTLSFILSIYSYNSFRIITPISMLLLGFYYVICNRKVFKKEISFFLIAFVLLLVSFVPIYRLNKLDSGNSRFQAVSIFNPNLNSWENGSNLVKSYFLNYNFNYLFITGDSNPRSQIPGMGQLYLWSLPFMILGIFYLLKRRNFLQSLPLFILIIAPIPAAITKESPHALRSITAVPFLSIIIGLGMERFVSLTKSKWSYFWITSPFILSFGFYLFVFNYFYILQNDSWQYGYNTFFDRYKDKVSGYSNIIVDDVDAQPYIFALYNMKFDPEKFRNEVVRNEVDKWGFSTVKSFENFQFKKFTAADLKPGKNLVVTRSNSPISDNNTVETIDSYSVNKGLLIYEINH